MKRPRVLLADDHRLIREAFAQLLAPGCDVVGAVADRRALLASNVEESLLENETAYDAPRTPVEEVIAGIWGEIFGRESVSGHDNFFELGGNSILATQVVSRVRDTFQVRLSLRGFFEGPTVVALAELIAGATKETVAATPSIRRSRSSAAFLAAMLRSGDSRLRKKSNTSKTIRHFNAALTMFGFHGEHANG